MVITNVGELRTAVADWINREDLSDDLLDQFINIAEDRILTDDRSSFIPLDQEYSREVTAASQVSPYFAMGDRIPSAAYLDNKVLKPVSWETYWTAKAEGANADQDIWTYYEGGFWYPGWPDRGEPLNFTAPTVTLRLKTESKSPLDLSDPANTNEMLTSHPEMYLYATLVEAASYLRDMEGVTLYQVRYDSAMDSAAKGYKRRAIANGFTVSSVGGDFNFDRSY